MTNSISDKNTEKKKRKFQVSNGYLLEFDQLARVLHILLEQKGKTKISRQLIMEESGLANRQVETLISMGAAMGLIVAGKQVLTDEGMLIAEHDIFIESKGSLEWCHYKGASTFRNLFWYDSFNEILYDGSAYLQSEWQELMRNKLENDYSDNAVRKGLREEIRFLMDAYIERNFSKLELLCKSSDDKVFIRRYTDFEPLVFCAMIYDFCAKDQVQLVQVSELVNQAGSPALVFRLDENAIREQAEILHGFGWIRYETTHSLDQIRLKPGYSAGEFLAAYYEERSPKETHNLKSNSLF
jgi:hypothetical protein